MPLKTITIEVESIDYGPIKLDLIDGSLVYSRHYELLDAAGQPVRQTVSDQDYTRAKTISGSVLWENVPTGIQNALIQIDNFIKAKILEREGIA